MIVAQILLLAETREILAWINQVLTINPTKEFRSDAGKTGRFSIWGGLAAEHPAKNFN
jgi:hypothetical protein